MWHDRIFNHLGQGLAFRGHHADTLCRDCTFYSGVYLYKCHLTLIINKRMCQLPLGAEESGASRWRAWKAFWTCLRHPHCQSKVYLPWFSTDERQPTSRRIPTENIQRRANWTQFTGARRTRNEPSSQPCTAHAHSIPLPAVIIYSLGIRILWRENLIEFEMYCITCDGFTAHRMFGLKYMPDVCSCHRGLSTTADLTWSTPSQIVRLVNRSDKKGDVSRVLKQLTEIF